MEKYLSNTIQSIAPSGIRRFFDLVMQAGDKVISLGVGEPDFPTPWHIRESAIFGLEKGFTCYSENAGLLELRKEISQYHYQQANQKYNPIDQVLVTNGASEAIDIAFRAIINPGDAVLIPDPGFVCYDALVRLAGGIPITYNPLKLDELEKIISIPLAGNKDGTEKKLKFKAILVNFPGNPLGNIPSLDEMQKLVELVKKYDLILLSDEIYSELSFDSLHKSLASYPEIQDQTLLFSGMSKSHSMTGFRIGWVCGHPKLIDAMNKIHQYAAMCAGSINQLAAIEALRRGQKEMKKMIKEYGKRRIFCLKKLKSLGVPTPHPAGAFYIFPDISASGLDEVTFCEKLLEESQCAIVPGSAFGKNGKNHVRMTYAASMEELTEFFIRFEKFWKKYTT